MYFKFKLLLMVKLLERAGRFPVVAIVTRQLMESQPPPLDTRTPAHLHSGTPPPPVAPPLEARLSSRVVTASSRLTNAVISLILQRNVCMKMTTFQYEIVTSVNSRDHYCSSRDD